MTTPSLDPISTPKRAGKRVPQRRSVPKLRRHDVRQPFFATDPAARRRKRAMYVTIGVLMTVLVIAWVATFRSSLQQSATTGNPFGALVEKIGALFQGPQQPATVNTNTADQERLRELRGRVFPQFQDAE